MQDLALAPRPALALRPEGVQRRGHLHADERLRLVDGLPALEQQLPGQVDVLRGHPRVVAADGEHAVAPEQPEDAGDDADAARQRLGAADEADDRGRLQYLHREQQAAAVGDVRRAGDGGHHRRAVHAGDEQLERLGVDVRVGVDDGDEPVPRLHEAGVEPVGLAAVDRVADHAAALVRAGRLERRRFGAIGRAVVEDEHLEHRVVGGERRPDAGRDDRLLVVGGDEHGHARPTALGLLRAPRSRPAGGRAALQPSTAPPCTRDTGRPRASNTSPTLGIPPLVPPARPVGSARRARASRSTERRRGDRARARTSIAPGVVEEPMAATISAASRGKRPEHESRRSRALREARAVADRSCTAWGPSGPRCSRRA